MTKIRQQVRSEPTGAVAVGQTVRVVRDADNFTLDVLTSDADGFVTYSPDGHPGPFTLQAEGLPTGARYWKSIETMPGLYSPAELPVALGALGDGVVRGYLDALAVSAGSGDSLAAATGAAVVVGVPVVNYEADTISVTRPVSSTRVDRVVVRLHPGGAATTPGFAEIALLAGTEGGSAPTLTQSTEVYEISLAAITVPLAAAITISDERTFAGERLSDQEIVRLTTITTTSAGGEYLTGLTETLTLDRAVTYDIEATLSGQQISTAATNAWALQNTYGPTFNSLVASNPGQVAVMSTGGILVADTGNDRLLVLSSAGAYSTGITGLTSITGVCVDSSTDFLYTLSESGGNMRLRQYDAMTLVLQWTKDFGTASGQGHLTTNGTHVWACASANHKVYRRLCSTGAAVDSFGTSGTGTGEFGTGGPSGIANDGTYLYVGDPGNDYLQKFTLAGVYVTRWSVSDVTGVGIDASGNVLVTRGGTSTVRRYTSAGVFVDQFAQDGAAGIDVATGDVLWVSNATAGTVTKWDEVATPGGYGQIALEIDSVVGTYTGIGLRDGAVTNEATSSKAGVSTCLVRAFGKATASTMTLSGAVLTARATPRG